MPALSYYGTIKDVSIAAFITKNKLLIGKLSLLFSAFLLLSIGFANLAGEVHKGDTLAYDEAVLRSIHNHATPLLDDSMIIYTGFGGIVFIIGVTLLLFAYLLYVKQKYKALLILFGVGGAGAVNLIIKAIFERSRPDLWVHPVIEKSFSFPSGHAMASSALAFSLVAILWKTKWRIPAIVGAGLYIVSIGFSRLYLGVHYPTDIVAGWFLSLLWVSLVAGFIYVRVRRRRASTSTTEEAA